MSAFDITLEEEGSSSHAHWHVFDSLVDAFMLDR